MDRGARRRAALLSAALLALVVVPGARLAVEGRRAPDGFPLSTYPMFTRDRGRVVDVPAVVINDGGRIVRLSPTAIADTDQVIEAHNVVARAVAAGGAASLALCRHVAEGQTDRLADGDGAAVIEVVVERYDAVDWAAGRDDPTARRVIASCP